MEVVIEIGICGKSVITGESEFTDKEYIVLLLQVFSMFEITRK